MFDVGEFVNSTVDKLCSSKIVSGIVSNSLLTSLLITVIVLIIVMCICRLTIQNDNERQIFKIGFYVFVSVAVILGLHHYTTVKAAEISASKGDIRSMYNGMRIGAGDVHFPPVDINKYDRDDNNTHAPYSELHQRRSSHGYGDSSHGYGDSSHGYGDSSHRYDDSDSDDSDITRHVHREHHSHRSDNVGEPIKLHDIHL